VFLHKKYNEGRLNDSTTYMARLDTFEIDGVAVSMMICASEFSPEVARLPAMAGAQVLASGATLSFWQKKITAMAAKL
jgi:predicted amidohydrolase